MALGGWWRLWIVLSIINATVITGICFYSWPTVENTEHGAWHVYRLSLESQDLIRTPHLTMADLEQELRTAHSAGEVDRARKAALKIREVREQPWLLNPRIVTGPNGHIFKLPAHATDEQVAFLSYEYASIIQEGVTRERGEIVRFGLVFSLAPPLLLLVIGLSVAWVRRGFKQTRAS